MEVLLAAATATDRGSPPLASWPLAHERHSLQHHSHNHHRRPSGSIVHSNSSASSADLLIKGGGGGRMPSRSEHVQACQLCGGQSNSRPVLLRGPSRQSSSMMGRDGEPVFEFLGVDQTALVCTECATTLFVSASCSCPSTICFFLVCSLKTSESR